MSPRYHPYSLIMRMGALIYRYNVILTSALPESSEVALHYLPYALFTNRHSLKGQLMDYLLA